MARFVTAGIRSAAFWQVAAGFVLGAVGTLATHSADAEREPPHVRPAPHWQLGR